MANWQALRRCIELFLHCSIGCLFKSFKFYLSADKTVDRYAISTKNKLVHKWNTSINDYRIEKKSLCHDPWADPGFLKSMEMCRGGGGGSLC